MKKKVLSILLMGIIVIVLTGCSPLDSLKSKDNGISNTGIFNIYNFGDGYFWVSTKDGTKLMDIEGNNVFNTPSGYEPVSLVHNKYFILNNKDYKDENRGYHIYSLETKKEKVLGEKISSVGIYRDKNYRISESNNFLIIKVLESQKKTMEGTNENYKYYKLDNSDLKEVDSKLIDSTYVRYTNAGASEFTNFKQSDYIDGNGVLGSDNMTYRDNYEWILYSKNDFFTIVHNGKYMFEPIEGEAIPNEGTNHSIVAKIDGKYYIYDENGKKVKELSYIPDDQSVIHYYDGYIATRENSSVDNIDDFAKRSISFHYYSKDGKEIILK